MFLLQIWLKAASHYSSLSYNIQWNHCICSMHVSLLWKTGICVCVCVYTCLFFSPKSGWKQLSSSLSNNIQWNCHICSMYFTLKDRKILLFFLNTCSFSIKSGWKQVDIIHLGPWMTIFGLMSFSDRWIWVLS